MNLPWDDLWAYVCDRGIARNETTNRADWQGDTLVQLAERTGMAKRTLNRWKERGSLPERSADRVAVALGVLPGEIWPWYLEDAVEEERARLRALEAGRRRRYRASHPDYVERGRAYAREYHDLVRSKRAV